MHILLIAGTILVWLTLSRTGADLDAGQALVKRSKPWCIGVTVTHVGALPFLPSSE